MITCTRAHSGTSIQRFPTEENEHCFHVRRESLLRLVMEMYSKIRVSTSSIASRKIRCGDDSKWRFLSNSLMTNPGWLNKRRNHFNTKSCCMVIANRECVGSRSRCCKLAKDYRLSTRIWSISFTQFIRFSWVQQLAQRWNGSFDKQVGCDTLGNNRRTSRKKLVSLFKQSTSGSCMNLFPHY